MTADDDNLAREYEHLEQMLGALDDAVAERDAAKARAIATARAVGAQLERLGHFARIADAPFDRDVARRLYWEYPDLHVREIAKPMNVREGSVASEMGTGTFEKECANECGRTVTWTMRSRSDSQRQPRLCSTCQTDRDALRAAQHAERQAEYARESEEDRALLREAMERGGAHRHYAEFPGVPGTWAVDENGVPLALID